MPPDEHTAAERERLKMEAQTRRRIEADVGICILIYKFLLLAECSFNTCSFILFSQLNGFDLTLQSNLMAEFEEKYVQ